MEKRTGRAISGDDRVVVETYDDGSWRVLRDGHADPAAGRELAEQHGTSPPADVLETIAGEMGGRVDTSDD